MKKFMLQSIIILLVLVLATNFSVFATGFSENSTDISTLNETESEKIETENEEQTQDSENLTITDNLTSEEIPGETEDASTNHTEDAPPLQDTEEPPKQNEHEKPDEEQAEGDEKQAEADEEQTEAGEQQTEADEKQTEPDEKQTDPGEEQAGTDETQAEASEEQTITYDPQPTTMEEIQTIIDTYEALPPEEAIKPHWQFEVDAELMPKGYYCGYEELDETSPYPYYTFFNLFKYATLSGIAVDVGSAGAFLEALRTQADEIILTDDITITVATAPLRNHNLSSEYDIVKDLIIYGQGHTLTLNCSIANRNYFRLTGNGTLKIYDLTLVNNHVCTSNFFSVYNPTNSPDSVWNAEFINLTFTGCGLIGQQNLTGARGSVGSVTCSGKTEINVTLDSVLHVLTGAVIYAKTVTFEDNVSISGSTGHYIQKGVIYAVDDIVINRDISAITTGYATYYGLLWSENGTIYFYGDADLNITQSGPLATYSSLIRAKEAKFFGNQTTINMTSTLTNSHDDEYALIYATDIELGKPDATSASDASLITINAKADKGFFKSPGSTSPSANPSLATSSTSFGSFTVNPHTIVNLEREVYYYGTISSTRPLIDGYTNFYFKEYCNFTAQAATNTHLETLTAIIRSMKIFDFILENNAAVSLTSLEAAGGNSALILKKPNSGCLTFTIMSGASLDVKASGTSNGQGYAPIQILGNTDQAESLSQTTIYGSLTTTARNGNGWYYRYSTSQPSGKDSFIVDGGCVNLISNALFLRTGHSSGDGGTTAQYATFEHFNRNELELLIKNGGYMLVKNGGWRAMSLAGGGVKTINVMGSGLNNITGEFAPSTLKLEGGQYAISAESGTSLYINVLEGGHFYSNNTQDRNIYTTGRAVYTVSGKGSQFKIRKSGTWPGGGSTYSLYGAILHDAPSLGPLEIYVEKGGYMYVESNYGDRATICAQSTSYRHKISVTDEGSYLAVINNNTTSISSVHYPLGAVAFSPYTDGDIYVENGGSFYAESHNPYTQTIALGGDEHATSSGTLFLNNPGSVDIRNDVSNSSNTQLTALRGRLYSSHTPDPRITIDVKNSDITVYKVSGSGGSLSYIDWPLDSIIRSWKDATFTAGNSVTVYDVMNGDGTDGMNGASAGSSAQNSFSLNTYGRIAAGSAARGGCRVIYDGNGGETADSITWYDGGLCALDTQYSVMDNNDIGFIKPRSTFICWNTKPDGEGDSYSPNDTLRITSDITLYAIWEKDADPQFTLPLAGGDGGFPFKALGTLLLGVNVLWAILWLQGSKLNHH